MTVKQWNWWQKYHEVPNFSWFHKSCQFELQVCILLSLCAGTLLGAGNMEDHWVTGRMIECGEPIAVLPSVSLPLYSIIGSFTLKGVSRESRYWPCAPVLPWCWWVGVGVFFFGRGGSHPRAGFEVILLLFICTQTMIYSLDKMVFKS